MQKRVIRIIYGAEPRASSRGLFRKLEILHVPCQYILSLILFIIDNANNLPTGLEMHGQQRRNKKLTFHSNCKPIMFKKELPILILKYISLPSNILNLNNDRKQF